MKFIQNIRIFWKNWIYNEKINEYISFWCRLKISPLVTFIWNFISKFNGKYTTLNYFFLFELIGILENNETNIDIILKINL